MNDIAERTRVRMNRRERRATAVLARDIDASSIRATAKLLGIDTLSARLTLEKYKPKPRRERWTHPRKACPEGERWFGFNSWNRRRAKSA